MFFFVVICLLYAMVDGMLIEPLRRNKKPQKKNRDIWTGSSTDHDGFK